MKAPIKADRDDDT